MTKPKAYVAGTFDTKAAELGYMAERIAAAGLSVVTVDLSTSGGPSTANVTPRAVAAFHPEAAEAVFTGDRGTAVAAMSEAFARFIVSRDDVGGVIGAGGSGGTALITPGLRALPVGTPKVMLSTVASGDVRPYVGPSDICMMYSVTDVQGLNRISRVVLANAAHALAGMLAHAAPQAEAEAKPAIGLSMFGVTTPCIQAVVKELEADHDCLVFHATGVGGQSMEKLAASRLLTAVLDITTTEVADLQMGGVFSAGEGRLDAIIDTGIPYVGSVGALDMVNFGAMETVPERYRNRLLHVHNPQVTLMRTTPEENRAMGAWIADKLNRMSGPVRFLLPLGGVSLIDAPDQPFYDAEADQALFETLEARFEPAPNRKLIKVSANVNDPAFVAAVIAAYREVTS